MKLWILEPIYDLKKKPDPWQPWFDKMFGIVIRADTKEEARQIAAVNKGDEIPEAWLDDSYSTCVELLSTGEPGVILRNVLHA